MPAGQTQAQRKAHNSGTVPKTRSNQEEVLKGMEHLHMAPPELEKLPPRGKHLLEAERRTATTTIPTSPPSSAPAQR